LVLAGCGQGPQTGPGAAESAAESAPVRVAFVTNNAADFWKIAEAGTRKAAGEFGCEVLFRIPAQGTAQEQQAIIEDLLVLNVSGIAISPRDPENQIELLNRVAVQVNLITQDSDAPESGRICYVGTDNYAAGVQAGELIKEALPEGGEIMQFVGFMDAENARQRMAGIADALEGSGITLAGTRTDEADMAKAIANVQDALVTHPELDGLVGLYAYNGPGILNAVRDSGKLGEIAIVCFDEEDETLQGVQDGHIHGTIVQQPFEFGYQSVKLLCELAEGNRSSVPDSGQLFVPTLAIKRDNVAEFWADLKRLLGEAGA
jgi:ribose transport system substrate-binding protein